MYLAFKVLINKGKYFSYFFFWLVPEYNCYNIKRLMKFNGKEQEPNCETYTSYRHVSGAYWPKAHIRMDGLDYG
jgi:hypothetical protein